MSRFSPVPCPRCGGLVDRQTVKCSRCSVQWATPQEMYFDGLCGCSERAYRIAECQDWNCVEAAVQGMQDVQDALSLRGKYLIEIERMER